MINSLNAPETPAEEAGSKRRLLIVILVAVVLLGLVGLGSRFLMSRFTEIERTLAGIERQVEEAAEKSEKAQSLATEAEASAREAALGRERAEAEASSAMEKMESAQEQARAAEEEAESARVKMETARAAAEESEKEAEEARQDAKLAREEAERVKQEWQAEVDRLQEALSRVVETRKTALGLVMNLSDDYLKFDFDKSNLRPENRELLSRIAGILLTSKDYSIEVIGHTDDIGTDEYNQGLSERRAQAVRDYLVEAGIDPDIITTKGLGKTQPLVPGTTPEARAKNRRVEIGIVNTRIEYGRR